MEFCDLTAKTCVPCRGGVPPLSPEEVAPLLQALGRGWRSIDDEKIVKGFAFPDFASALAFVNLVGEVAEREGHHPEVLLSFGRVDVTIYTRKIDGLTESDFILASKIEDAG